MAIYLREDSALGKIYFVEDHVKRPVQGVFGKPFFSVDYLLKKFDLKLINEEICFALAKEKNRPLATLAGHIPKDFGFTEPSLFENQYLYNLIHEPDYEVLIKRLSDLSEQERRWYLIFLGKISTPWLFSIPLIKGNFLNREGSDKDFLKYGSIIEYLPYTKELISALPFSTIGRVVIYGSHPGVGVPPHRDWEYQDKLFHQININPGGYRPVYIFDSQNNKKIYLNKDCLAYIYNTLDVHGVEPNDKFSYTLRIDGKFNEDFLKTLS